MPQINSILLKFSSKGKQVLFLIKCHQGAKTAEKETEPLEVINTGSNLSVVKVTAQGDVTDQLRTVHQVCKKPAKREEEEDTKQNIDVNK